MPRPGPRPYECVRRAWHSDRHQPMRGSLIQEIFRVVSEAHSPATRRNREWQEKLPCVVLKAEEIMYSKANSEAEYMDPKTLWSRAVDAIDTIIRRDDANESQDLLQPCIEAALNLGCTPRRASRSQRHSNPGCYLSFNASRDVSAAVPNKVTDQNKMHHLGSSATLLSQLPCHSADLQYSSSQLYTTLLGTSATSSTCRGAESMSLNASSELKDSSANSMPEYPFSGNSSFLNWQPAGLSTSVGSCALSSYGRVYPLYYGEPQFRTVPQHCGQNPQDAICNTITAVDTSVLPFGQVEMDFLHNFLGSSPAIDSGGRGSRIEEHSVHPPYPVCSLSLGLGLPLGPTLLAENAWARRFENVASDDSCEGKSSCY